MLLVSTNLFHMTTKEEIEKLQIELNVLSTRIESIQKNCLHSWDKSCHGDRVGENTLRYYQKCSLCCLEGYFDKYEPRWGSLEWKAFVEAQQQANASHNVSVNCTLTRGTA